MTITIATTTFLYEINEALHVDPFAQDILNSIKTGEGVDTRFSQKHGILYYDGKIYLPSGLGLREKLLNLFHG